MKIKAYKLTDQMKELLKDINDIDDSIEAWRLKGVSDWTYETLKTYFKCKREAKELLDGLVSDTYPELNFENAMISRDFKYLYVNEYYQKEIEIIGE